MQTVEQALAIMGQGMGGIFITIVIIMAAVMVMSYLGKKKK